MGSTQHAPWEATPWTVLDQNQGLASPRHRSWWREGGERRTGSQGHLVLAFADLHQVSSLPLSALREGAV